MFANVLAMGSAGKKYNHFRFRNKPKLYFLLILFLRQNIVLATS